MARRHSCGSNAATIGSTIIPKEVDDFFSKYDENGDGFLSFHEFSKAVEAEGIPSYMASTVFFANDKDHNGKLDRNEFAELHASVQKPVKKSAPTFHDMIKHVAGEPHYLNDLTFEHSQCGGSHLGGFFKDAGGGKFYVKFPGVRSIWNDDERSLACFEEIKSDPTKFYPAFQSQEDKVQSRSEVLVSKLYGMVGVEAAFMRFVFVAGHEEDGPIGLWSRNMNYDEIDTHQMVGMPGLKEGFAADAWLANWDVIGNGSPEELNMKRQKNGSAFRLDFGGCLQYRATGGDKAETGTPFTGESVPETTNLRKFNRVFSDVTDEDIALGSARIAVGSSDKAIREAVEASLGPEGAHIAEKLIGRKSVLMKEFPAQSMIMKMFAKLNIRFYMKAATKFLKGGDDKNPVSELRIAGIAAFVWGSGFLAGAWCAPRLWRSLGGRRG